MGYSKSISGFLVCCIVSILVVSNEMHEVEAKFAYTSDCQQACQKVEQRSAHGCLFSCMYRCMPLVGSTNGCHPDTEVDTKFPHADPGLSSSRKIKS